MARETELHIFEQKTFRGLNKDIPAERLPPEFFTTLTNMQTREKGIPETINGTTLVLDLDVNAKKLGYFPTRGEDYLFVWCGDYGIRVYKYDKGSLTAYNNWSDDNTLPGDNVIEIDDVDLLMYEEVWFAEHFNEFYFGNMSEGMYRFSPGHQSVIRGSAPLDVVVEPAEEGKGTKLYTEWWFAYDYEYKGGRGPLSRKARARLYSNKHKVKVTMDYPPIISKNRRIYASPDDSNWYFVKEETDRNIKEVILDAELVDRISDEYIYNEKVAKAISPKAKFGIKHDNMLWVSYLGESPSLVKYFDPYHPYAEERNFFDVGEGITNVISFREYHIATTPNKIWALRAKPDEKILAEGSHGAYAGSLAVVNNVLYCLTDRGVKVSKDGFNWESLPGIDSVDFSGLQKNKRFALWTAQQDYEEGTYNDGISSDYIPGALCLQPNLYELETKSIIDGQWSGIGSDDRMGTSLSDGAGYFHQPFQFIGDAGDYITAKKLHLWMKAWHTEGRTFTGWIAPDNPDDAGQPDLNPANALAEFEGAVAGDISYDRIFDLSQTVSFEANTTYHIVVPKQGVDGEDWQLYTRSYEGPDTTQNPLYPQGQWLRESSDGKTWSNVVKDGDNVILRFAFEGWAPQVLLNPLTWLTHYGGESDDSDTYDFAQDIISPMTCTLKRIEIAVRNKSPSTDPVITIESDSDGEPSGVALSTASDFSHPGLQVIRADLGGEEISIGDKIWIRIHKTDSSGYTYCEIPVGSEYSGKKSDDDGSTWENTTTILWCKLFVEPSAEAIFMAEGDWESQEVDIGDDNNFEKLFVNLMNPKQAGIKIEINGYAQSEGDYLGWTTVYDTTGANDTDSLPYDIETNLATDIKKIKVKVTLELSTSKYTPLVDSILATYKRDGDAGDKLHAGNVKGDYYLSNEDYDGDSSTEFTYVFNKYRNWAYLDKPVFDFLLVEDNVCLGIMKNPTESYKNIYKLDDKDSDSWFSGDASDEDVYTLLETGDLFDSYTAKVFRKNWITARGDYGENLFVDIIAGSVERLAINSASAIHSKKIELESSMNFKPYYISLPRKMEGRWVKVRIAGYGTDWSLSNFIFHYWQRPLRNIVVPSLATTEYIHLANYNDGLRAYTFEDNEYTNVGHIDDGGTANFVWVKGNLIFLANGGDGIRIYLFNGTTYTNIAHIDDGGTANVIHGIHNEYLFLANGADGLRAYTFNGTTINNVAHIQDMLQTYGVWSDGTYVFTAAYNGGGQFNGPRAYRFDGSSLTYITGVNITTAAGTSNFIWGDNKGYIYYCHNGGLKVYTFDGNAFTEIDTITTGTTDGAQRLWVNGTYVHIADRTAGLKAYQLLNGEFSSLLDSIDNGGEAYGVWGDNDGYIHLANSADGLRAYTFEDNEYTNVGHIDDGGTAYGVWGTN